MGERLLTEARQRQGFKSQAHLDDFYLYYDHTRECAECNKPGPWVELSDGLQPTANRCEIARQLDRNILKHYR